MGYLFKNGKIVRHNSDSYIADILIKDNLIEKVGKINEKDFYVERVIDLEGKHVFPGVIDMHAHLREPGSYVGINIKTQTEAAVKSGITTVVAMPNTNPVCDKIDIYNRIQTIINENALCDVVQIMAGTHDIDGKIVSEFDTINDIVAISDDGKSIDNSRILFEVLKKVKKNNLVYLSHAEDDRLRKDGVINFGSASKKFGLEPIFNEVEDIRTYRDSAIASTTKANLHFCHLSTKESLNIVKKFKEKDANVTCEVTPHHLFLSDQNIKKNTGLYKMNPPLRSEDDRKALLKGIEGGSIDVIATDHAPHPMENKLKDFNESSFGIIGFETLIPLCIENLYYKNDISLSRIAELISFNPAKILNLTKRGVVKEGQYAYLTVVDLDKTVKINKDFIKSKTYNTPFLNRKLRGKPLYSLVNGKLYDIEKERWYENK